MTTAANRFLESGSCLFLVRWCWWWWWAEGLSHSPVTVVLSAALTLLPLALVPPRAGGRAGRRCGCLPPVGGAH